MELATNSPSMIKVFLCVPVKELTVTPHVSQSVSETHSVPSIELVSILDAVIPASLPVALILGVKLVSNRVLRFS